MKKRSSIRLAAMLLCIAMVLPGMLCGAALQTTNAAPLAVVYAGSDFQYPFASEETVYEENAAVMREIVQRIKMDYPTVDEAFILGDYHHKFETKETSDPGVAAVRGVLNEAWGMDYDRILFVQGNHDPYNTSNLDTTGAHDREHYGVYQINEDDFPSYADAEAAVQATAADLKEYLDEKTASGYSKPVFVITHVPLHHSYRGGANGRTDNSYARYLVDVLNEAGEKGLNIIFMFGHNHGGFFDNYLGSDCVYYQPGQSIYVTDPAGGTVNDFESVTIRFTYMNAGYLGYVPNNGTLSSTVFEIYEDRVEIARYNGSGQYNLKDPGESSEYDRGWSPDASVVESPQVLSLSRISLSVVRSTLGRSLAQGSTAGVQIGVSGADSYSIEWETGDSTIASVTPDAADPTKAEITAIGGGTTYIKVAVRGDDGAPAALYFDFTVVPDDAVPFNNGETAVLYRLVEDWSTLSIDQKYMIVSTDQNSSAYALGAMDGSGNRVDPKEMQSAVPVFQLPGDDAVYSTPRTDSDIWSLVANADETACYLRLASQTYFVAVGDVVDESIIYTFDCGFRISSSTTSDGTAQWTVDEENHRLKLVHYYLGGIRTPASSYALTFNEAESSFWLGKEPDSTTGALYLYEQTNDAVSDLWMWVEGSGNIRQNGSGDTGGEILIMLGGEISRIPVTTDMLSGADLNTPGTQTCAVVYNGHTLTEDFQITVFEAPVLTPLYPTLSFEGEIFCNIYFTAENLDNAEELGLITFDIATDNGTIHTADAVIPGATAEDNGTYRVRTQGIAAKKLGDELYFRVYARLTDGSYAYSDTYSYSARAYAEDRLANSASEKIKALCVAMLNYGAAAQLHFGHNTDDLMNAGLTDEQKALVGEYHSGMVDDIAAADSAKSGSFAYNADGYTSRYPSVSFEGAFSIHYYFTPAYAMDGDMTLYYWTAADYNSADVLTAENASGSMVMTAAEAGSYEGVYAGIAAKEIDSTVYVAGIYESGGVSYATGILPYSLGAYCVDRIANSSGSMRDLAKAAAVYGFYAKAYFA